LAGAIWFRHLRRYDTTTRHDDDADTTTTMPDPCSESVPPWGGGWGTEALRHDDDD
jgi:hypothetical protein